MNMEFIKRLANNLFGKRKTYDAKELGIFYSKVWNCWKNESYYWFTSMKFSVYREETFLCINGDSDAPFQPQIFCLREVLNNWEEIRSQISRIIPKHVRYTLNPQLHSRSATYIKRNGLLIRKITIKSSRPFQCAYHPLTP